ncbi:N-formylglutamate deformylase [Cupriavidus sp. NPDC089707]|uniref:N-formylglutamate deformylase n=1 Tax=Cupriavidus sp. NPDC089707 TaxID=3363963 RepID=UPI00380664EC
MTDTQYKFRKGTAPILISIPHLGREIPPEIQAEMNPHAAEVSDTDWHLDRIYAFAESIGASVLCARYSRYVVDLNRPASGESLYPGQTTTGLFPTETFRGEPLYRKEKGPDAATAVERLETYWRPYHAKIESELARLKAEFGAVLLWEGHSIASELPRLFDGKLPDLNLGTDSGKSCAPHILQAVTATLSDQPFSWVANGRFKGGYITRHYGNPGQGIHAIQLEMCQSTYMNELAPFEYRDDLAEGVKPVVERMVRAALAAVLEK